MTVRDWLDLLVVPLALVVIGFLFTMQQDARQQDLENQRAEQAQRIENQRAEAERELAVQRAQDEALQAYLSQMSSLLLERNLRDADKDSEVSTLARARTVSVLQRLDANRNQTVTRFLNEARLTGSAIGLLVEADLQGAHLEHTDLQDADLTGARLSDANGADLSGADLRYARLSGANLNWADLSGVEMSGANLTGGTHLNDAILSGADLRGADLRDARGITNGELDQQAGSLEGATMPNGQKYEVWLKDRDKRQQDE
jgi:uncharacterized protein YjbI with pentapeptide repeats